MNTLFTQITLAISFSFIGLFCSAQSIETITDEKRIEEILNSKINIIEYIGCEDSENQPCPLMFLGENVICDCGDGATMSYDIAQKSEKMPQDYRNKMKTLKEEGNQITYYQFFKLGSKRYVLCHLLENEEVNKILIVR
jgi:hypothetical protein